MSPDRPPMLDAPTVVALMALGLALGASPDVPLLGLQPSVGGILAGLSALFVVTLVDRRTPRRLVALGAATLALAVGYDALRGQQGTLTLIRGQGTRLFEETGPGGRPLGLRPLGEAVALESVEADGSVVLAEGDGAAMRRARVSPDRAAMVAGYRIGEPRRNDGAMVLSVNREPAALLAALGALVAAVGVAWSRW